LRELNDDTRIRGQHRSDHGQRPPCDEETHRAAEHRKQHRFGEQLCEELTPRGAEGEAHRHLQGAVGAAREQQIRDVGAGDEENDPGDRKQEDEWHPRLAVDRALSARAWLDGHLLCLESRQCRRAHSLL